MDKRLLILFTLFIGLLPLSAQQIEVTGARKAVRTSGDIGVIALPVAGLAAVLIQQDWQGLKQGALAAVTTAGITYALKYSVRKERPDHSDHHSFPFHAYRYPRSRQRLLSNGVTAGNGGFRIHCIYLRGLEPHIRQEA